tara:strand:- start:6147 stop:6701 length:555 start_codon:yes stop_codon:yes gene_type:complete
MVEMNCPHCSEVIVLPSSEPGSYECPYCDKIFKIGNKQTSQNNSITNRENLQKIKLTILTPLGIFFAIYGITLFFEDFFFFDYNPFGLVFFFCGLYLLIPLLFAKQDREAIEIENQAQSMLQTSKNIRVTNPGKSVVKGVLGTSIVVSSVVSIIIAIIAIVLVIVIIAITYAFLAGSLSSGSWF